MSLKLLQSEKQRVLNRLTDHVLFGKTFDFYPLFFLIFLFHCHCYHFSIDIDECVLLEPSMTCGMKGKCVNTNGGYRCHCDQGFKQVKINNMNKCVGKSLSWLLSHFQ